MKKYLLLLPMLLLPACSVMMRVVPQTDTFTDTRDGQVYKTVTIGKQTWLAQNLNYKTTSNCVYYNNDPKMAQPYGLLYNFSVLNQACPKGWHIPSNAEWEELEYNIGMSETEVAATGFGTRGTAAGNVKPGGAAKLDLVYGGQYGQSKFINMGSSGHYWTSVSQRNIISRIIRKGNPSIDINVTGEAYYFSVRCVKDGD